MCSPLRYLFGNSECLFVFHDNPSQHDKVFWKKSREMLSPILMQSSVLNNFVPTMCDVVKDKLSKTSQFDGAVLGSMVFNIAWLFIVGKRELQCKEDVKQYYWVFRNGLQSLPYNFPGSTLRKALDARAKIGKIVNHIVETEPTAKTDTNCCLSGFMTGSYVEIEQRVIGILFAAYESIVSALNGLLWSLVNNPQVLEKLQNEIREIDCVPMTVGDFQKFPYTNKVVHEALRIYGSPFVMRRNKVPISFKNYVFPKDTNFLVMTGHEHQQVFNPTQFNPDREDKYRWEPFGTGPRNCLGKIFAQLEMKMILYHLMKYFDITIEKDKDASLALDFLRMQNARFLLKPVDQEKIFQS